MFHVCVTKMMAREEEMLVTKILPPSLEDAGLEDCALPPAAIKEAFLKAASAARSLISLSDDDDDDCLNDPWPTTKADGADVVLGGDSHPPSTCSVVKAGDLGGGDRVAVIGVNDDDDDERESKADVVAPALVEEGASCVDGMRGLKIADKGIHGHKENKLTDDDDEEEDSEKEKPILAQGFV